jgi:hypothetical protein
VQGRGPWVVAFIRGESAAPWKNVRQNHLNNSMSSWLLNCLYYLMPMPFFAISPTLGIQKTIAFELLTQTQTVQVMQYDSTHSARCFYGPPPVSSSHPTVEVNNVSACHVLQEEQCHQSHPNEVGNITLSSLACIDHASYPRQVSLDCGRPTMSVKLGE